MGAVATRAAQTPVISGLEATFHAASGGGDKVPPNVDLEVVNDDASDKTLTIVTPGTAYGQPIGDQAVVITAGERRHIRIPDEGFTGSDGLVSLTWSAVTDVTFAVLAR